MNKQYLESAKDLYDAIASLKSAAASADLSEALCTTKEIADLSQRFQVAKLLQEKKSYNEISLLTGASTATISRVSRCVQYGDGYKTALKKKED